MAQHRKSGQGGCGRGRCMSTPRSFPTVFSHDSVGLETAAARPLPIHSRPKLTLCSEVGGDLQHVGKCCAGHNSSSAWRHSSSAIRLPSYQSHQAIGRLPEQCHVAHFAFSHTGAQFEASRGCMFIPSGWFPGLGCTRGPAGFDPLGRLGRGIPQSAPQMVRQARQNPQQRPE